MKAFKKLPSLILHTGFLMILTLNHFSVVIFVQERIELDKSVVMVWVGSPAQSQMSLFLEYPFPQKSTVMSLKQTWQK